MPNKRLVQRGTPARPTALGLHLPLCVGILAAQYKRKELGGNATSPSDPRRAS